METILNITTTIRTTTTMTNDTLMDHLLCGRHEIQSLHALSCISITTISLVSLYAWKNDTYIT